MERFGRMFGQIGRFIRFGSSIGPLIRVLGGVLSLIVIFDKNYDQYAMRLQNQDMEFDFVIVGAGSAGSSLANKLSEKYSVLVLEAGGTPSYLQSVPIYAFYLFNLPAIDWAHFTVPQKNASFALNNKSVLWPSGKQLGGSSQLNAMMYIRGNVQGFDEIAKITGDPRWNTSNMLRYYKSIEDYHGWFENPDHGKGGPMSIERPNLAKFTKYFMEAGEELGYPIRDPNPYGPYKDGVAMMDLYMKNGRRSDAFHGFLEPIMKSRRSLLTVRKYSLVRKIIFHPSSNHASGVEYERHGKLYNVRARKEVILCAGSLNSAKLLMLSGIGPKKDLESIGIESRLDLPVGQYLQDKYGAVIGPFIVDKGNAIDTNRDMSVGNFIDWFFRGQGGVTRGSLAEGTWAITTDSAKKEGRVETPNIHTYILSIASAKESESETGRSWNLKPSTVKYMTLSEGQDSFAQLVTLNKPSGYGYVKLRDSNPRSTLEIDPKYLENDRDFKDLVEGLKFAVKIVEETQSFRPINAHLMPIPFPGCESYTFKSHEYFECLARQVTVTAYKYAGTAPIGKDDKSDPYSVVDSHLRVFGTKGLRVVDGSVLQQKYVSINDVTCRMLGVFAGDMIKEDWAHIPDSLVTSTSTAEGADYDSIRSTPY